MRLSKSLCAVVGSVLQGSHGSLNALFTTAGAPGEPPQLSHGAKWKEWLFRTGQDPSVDSLAVLGNVLEEFMDLPPTQGTPEYETWKGNRARVEAALQDNGLRYFRFGQVLPQGEAPRPITEAFKSVPAAPAKPQTVEELLEIVVNGLRRAMHPMEHRRKGIQSLSFSSEYDVQDLLHAMLRPWIADIRPEEYTPSYAGSSTRMDFLLVAHALVIETKIVRDAGHAKRIGNELILDIEHYRKHPACERLWCVIYDAEHLITNPAGLVTDLQEERQAQGKKLTVRVFVL